MTHDEDAVIEAAPAKINLYLEVTNRRDNGYHDLDSLVVFADVGERLTARLHDGLELEIVGPMAPALAHEEDNLVLRAARLLQQEAGVTLGAALQLEKHIPVASGVGGGSADAAATLRGLNQLWRLGASEEDLMNLGLKLGADVPVCVRSRPSRFQGIGEICSDGPTLPSGLALCLVNPMVGVSTGPVFSKVKPRPASGESALPDAFDDFALFTQWLSKRRNDLMGPAALIEPSIQKCVERLEKISDMGFVRMSGSGATCFVLCPSKAIAESIKKNVENVEPNWWAWQGRLYQ